MAVVDGMVTGPQKCAIDGCTTDVVNLRGGVFCATHLAQYGHMYHIQNCQNLNVDGTHACREHQHLWARHIANHSRQTYAGARRAINRPAENLPWQTATVPFRQAHDEHALEGERSNYFTASHYYCVETICAPYGVVTAWTKFDKSESPTKILEFLEKVYPTEESKPAYICIDKACLVLRTAVANGSWDRVWKSTTCFIKWCNPAPKDGSAPNLVVVAYDNCGNPYYKRAFNTQACEQLNTWLGGFDSIIRRMKPSNFDWFLHAMMFYHTRYVIEKQASRDLPPQVQQEEQEEDEDEETEEQPNIDMAAQVVHGDIE
ncbi:hypothetical protein BDZ94DRAFT_1292675 [Collybia nuda]|uniref:CxC6 like cysteine cluster associated with KDZ domain-containing protein n=1 Tax=Collybia nuda TaxID=64659 RepID=A0A9P6CC77_9AGAR|nr:hypothetical protein BDZ94DRAFT_1292675 [Collybia nuda]